MFRIVLYRIIPLLAYIRLSSRQTWRNTGGRGRNEFDLHDESQTHRCNMFNTVDKTSKFAISNGCSNVKRHLVSDGFVPEAQSLRGEVAQRGRSMDRAGFWGPALPLDPAGDSPQSTDMGSRKDARHISSSSFFRFLRTALTTKYRQR